MSFDGKSFGKEIVETVKGHIDKTVAPLLAELAALKAEVATLKAAPKDGKDADAAAVAVIVAADFRKDLDALRGSVEALPKKAPELPDIPAMIRAEVDKVTGDVCRIIPEQVMAAVAVLPPAESGKDADPELVASLVKSEAERILAGWQRPQDGKSVTAEELAPLIEDRVQRAVSAIPVPEDGRNGLDAIEFLTKDGHLLVTMSNGTVRDLGLVQGKDGADGRDGAPGERGLDGQKGLDGTNGEPGQHGRDGADGAKGLDGKDGVHGRDGKDAEPVTKDQIIEEIRSIDAIPVAVQQYLEANPPASGKDGRDGIDGKDGAAGLDGKNGADGVHGKDGSPGLNGKDGSDGLHGKDGRDAVDLADMLVVEGGDVVATFADGRTKVLGPFRGKDGADGKDGRDIDTVALEKMVDDKIAKAQPPEIERDAYKADIAKMIDDAVAKQSAEEVDEFAPDEVAANIALSIKMIAERPVTRAVEPEVKAPASPTINIALSDNREPSVVNVAPPNVIIEAKRTKEVTKVTKHDSSGRIEEFEKSEVDDQ